MKTRQSRSERSQPRQPDRFLPEGRQVYLYLRRCLSLVAEAAVLLVVTIAVYAGLLYVCRSGWHLYLATPMGKQFVDFFPQTAESTSILLQMDLVALSRQITLHAFVICLAVGSLCRLLYLARYLHEQFGVVGRVLFCGLPMAAIVAMYVQPLYGFQEWETALLAVLLPTLVVASPSFRYAERLLPELGDIKKQLIG